MIKTGNQQQKEQRAKDVEAFDIAVRSLSLNNRKAIHEFFKGCEREMLEQTATLLDNDKLRRAQGAAITYRNTALYFE